MSRWEELIARLAAVPARERDALIEREIGLGEAPSTSPGVEMIGYHPSGIAPIVRALCETPVNADDLVIDMGAGLGKVVRVAETLARTRGVERQPVLAERARAICQSEIVTGDVRDVDLSDGTVFFLYLPFTGRVMVDVLEKLRVVARHHPIVVCALGAELRCDWLVPRPTDAFWLVIYDSAAARAARPLSADERAVAFEL